jgi:TPR repeat protein
LFSCFRPFLFNPSHIAFVAVPYQDLQKETQILKEENKKLKQLAKSQVENIIEPAAKKGDVGAIQVVGECYQHGLGGKRSDEKQAIEYYEQGVFANNPASQCSLGALLVEQKDDEKANERGVELLKKSAAAEYPEGQYELALCEWNGEAVQEDKKSAVELWTTAANNDFARAQYEIGQCYEKGEGGIQKDLKQAEQWYLKAALDGYVMAQLGLGRIYQTDEKDINEAIEWYEKAYYNGQAKEASEALRTLFNPSNKYAVADLDKAIDWSYRENNLHWTALLLDRRPGREKVVATIKGLSRAAIHQQNFATAYTNLANMSKQGKQIKFPLYRRAAALGSTFAMCHVADFLPDHDPEKLHYILTSAEHRTPTPKAQWELGVLYETGRCGLEKNLVLAKEWKDKALANGFKPPSAS